MKIVTLCILTLFTAALPAAGQTSLCFDTAANYSTSSYPVSVASADFNSDGKPDLALACRYGSEEASVLLNAGAGTFSAAVNYITGNAMFPAPLSVTSADLNGDGKADLAFAIADSVGILLNMGTGTFAAPVTYPAGSGPLSVVSADFNQDGKPDLAVSNSDNKISVLLNTGTCIFAAPLQYAVDLTPRCIIAPDLNGDGNPDLATANTGSNSVSVLLNAGSGTFNSSFSYAVGANPRSVAAADFNRDGKTDLVSANTNDNTLTVLLNDGTGNFNSSGEYAPGGIAGPSSVTAADLDGDGAPEIASVDLYPNGTVNILPNDGTGNFGTAISYTVGTYPWALITADLNGDTKLDIVVANSSSNNVSVLLQCSPAGVAYSSSVDNLKFYPNPVTSLLQIELTPQDKFQEVQVSDILGKVTTMKTVRISDNTVQIDLSSLSPGVYFLQVDVDGNRLTKQIIKE